MGIGAYAIKAFAEKGTGSDSAKSRLCCLPYLIWHGDATVDVVLFDVNYNLPYLSGVVIMLLGFFMSMVLLVLEKRILAVHSTDGRNLLP